MKRIKWHKTLVEARKHLKELQASGVLYDGYEVYHKRGSRRKKSYAVCTHLQWINEI